MVSFFDGMVLLEMIMFSVGFRLIVCGRCCVLFVFGRMFSFIFGSVICVFGVVMW